MTSDPCRMCLAEADDLKHLVKPHLGLCAEHYERLQEDMESILRAPRTPGEELHVKTVRDQRDAARQECERLQEEIERLKPEKRASDEALDKALSYSVHRHFCQVVVSGRCSCGLYDAAKRIRNRDH